LGVTNLSISNVAGDYAIDKQFPMLSSIPAKPCRASLGRLEVSYDFTQGQQGVLIAQAFSYATICPARSVPEPSSLLLGDLGPHECGVSCGGGATGRQVTRTLVAASRRGLPLLQNGLAAGVQRKRRIMI